MTSNKSKTQVNGAVLCVEMLIPVATSKDVVNGGGDLFLLHEVRLVPRAG